MTSHTPAHVPKQGMAAASLIMAAGTTVSRILGFVRTALLALAIGATTVMADIFERANSIPNLLYVLLAGGMFNVVLVPQLIKAAKAPDRGSDYTSRLLTLTALVMLAATALITAAAYPIMRMLTLGWSEPMVMMGTAFALWTLPQILFYGLYAVVGQVLNAHARFGWFMWAPVLNNVIAIGFIGFFLINFGYYRAGDDQLAEWTTTQTVILAGGHSLGVLCQALLLLWPLSKLGLRLRPRFRFRGMGLGQTGKIAAWTLATMTVGNVSLMLHMRLISGATAAREEVDAGGAAIPGEYAATTAELIAILPHSVFVLALATVLFNQLSAAMHEGRFAEARAHINKGLRIFAIPIMFSMVVMIVLAGPLARMFAGAAEDADLAGAAIAQLLILFAVALPFRSTQFYLIRVFYAAEDARTPLMVTLIIASSGQLIAHLALLVLPAQYMPYLIVALWGAMNVARFLIFHRLITRRWGPVGTAGILTAYVRSGFAAVAAGAIGAVIAWLLGGYTWGFAWESIITALITCVVTGAVMGAVYFLLLRAMRVREFGEFMEPLTRKIPALARLAG